MDKRKNNGITLVSLVITIIIMLILAGVSINAAIGENGIVTRAADARIAADKAGIIEQIEYALTNKNIDTITDDVTVSAANAIGDLLSQNIIDSVMMGNGQFSNDITRLAVVPSVNEDGSWNGKFQYVVAKGEYAFNVYQDEQGLFKAELSDISVSNGGDVAGGTILVTQESFTDEGDDAEDKGKYTIIGDANVIFTDEISGELSLYIRSGVTANVSVFKNMTLTNANVERSAIEIETGGTLNLWTANGATVTVNSGLGRKGSGYDYQSINPGGYAGIHVPIGATISLKGQGVVKAYGGDAADGNAYIASNNSTGGTGGGGAGAGIGGNGGYGSGYAVGKGSNGGAGEGCGIVNIYDTVTVYAYGGRGGNGVKGTQENGSGGGGYPGAGIGGGGAGAAGGTCCAGGGGYSGGGGDGYVGRPNTTSGSNRGVGGDGGTNGNSSERVDMTFYPLMGGCGYNEEDISIINSDLFNDTTFTKLYGGMGGVNSRSGGHYAGDGGTAGIGGTINVDNNSTVYAFNGNKYTDGTSYENGINQTIIYLQNGIKNVRYSISTARRDSALSYSIAQQYDDKIEKSGYINPITNNTQGIGSGAGYIEVSNGTYTLCNQVNGELVPIL